MFSWLLLHSICLPVSTEDCTAGFVNQNMDALHNNLKSFKHQSYECIISWWYLCRWHTALFQLWRWVFICLSMFFVWFLWSLVYGWLLRTTTSEKQEGGSSKQRHEYLKHTLNSAKVGSLALALVAMVMQTCTTFSWRPTQTLDFSYDWKWLPCISMFADCQ